MRLSQKETVCHKCNDKIQPGQNAVIAMGYKWHEHCFCCPACNKRFETGFLDHRGQPYHEDCLPKTEEEEYSTVCAKWFGFSSSHISVDRFMFLLLSSQVTSQLMVR
jgi:hypothetical protein